MAQKTAITPTREQDYPEWYQQVIKGADLAETTSVRGCMVMKPWGYGLWENMQKNLDARLKATGHKNIYCPVFIPLAHLEKEAQHVEGFAKECAVVTHSRLETNSDGKLVPASPLPEPLIVRPTSETMIGELFSKWIQSYRDLPVLINQWANVVRWEMRTRLFLRTTEFLWQEGHTAHASSEDAVDETLKMLDVYADFSENILAMPVIKGEKTESERFPGATSTYCIEALMQDRKALQAGTSHFLGQNFSRAFDIKYLSEAGKEELVWTTSWGVSTRLIGGLIMTHSDDDGLIVPPRIAPVHVVILPIMRKNKDATAVLAYCDKLANELQELTYHKQPIIVEVDKRELTGGEKAWSWVKKGVPIRIEVGDKECEQNTVYMGRRDLTYKEKTSVARDEFIKTLTNMLDDIQAKLFGRAKTFQKENSIDIDNKEAFYDYFNKTPGGFAYAHWCGDAAIEEQIKKDLNVTIRCLPLDEKTPGKCIFPGKDSRHRAVFAKAY
jgi:prolyl-tRNA synthetase